MVRQPPTHKVGSHNLYLHDPAWIKLNEKAKLAGTSVTHLIELFAYSDIQLVQKFQGSCLSPEEGLVTIPQ